MTPVHILVAEDDGNIRMGLVDILESEGYVVTQAVDGTEALALYTATTVDLVLLDIMMPGKSGYDVLKFIRTSDNNVPIIMLTAKGEEIDKVVGLELGADDYITKPFGVHELLARIAAVLRRARRQSGSTSDACDIPDCFSFGRATVDVLGFRGQTGDTIFDLSAREIDLLKFFYAHPDEVLSRNRLLNAVWGIDYYGTTRTLDQHIAQLRKKIEPDPRCPSIITTVHGVGYRYESARSAVE